MSSPRPSRGRRRSQRSQPSDLGPVAFRLRLRSRPLTGPAPAESEGVGLLADLAAAHSRGWCGDWRVSFGSLSLELGLPMDAEILEEFWVFLIELVDSDGGEWSLRAGDDELTIEAQVFGPDVNLEFVSDGRSPRFGGKTLPRRATVRLRALVCEGSAFLSSLVSESCRLDPGLRDREDLAGLEADLAQAQEAVASLPGTFAGKS